MLAKVILLQQGKDLTELLTKVCLTHSFLHLTCSQGGCFINEPWTMFESYLKKVHREVRRVSGDGFCLFGSISEALWQDYGILISPEHIKQIVKAHLKEHGQQYAAFHTNSKEQLLEDYEAFLESREFDVDVVDILSRIAADALYVNIYTYQENNGLIYLMKFTPSLEATKKVYLQFLHDDNYPLANHYNAVIMKKDKYPEIPKQSSSFPPLPPPQYQQFYPSPPPVYQQFNPYHTMPHDKAAGCNISQEHGFKTVRVRQKTNPRRKKLDRNAPHMQLLSLIHI